MIPFFRVQYIVWNVLVIFTFCTLNVTKKFILSSKNQQNRYSIVHVHTDRFFLLFFRILWSRNGYITIRKQNNNEYKFNINVMTRVVLLLEIHGRQCEYDNSKIHK